MKPRDINIESWSLWLREVAISDHPQNMIIDGHVIKVLDPKTKKYNEIEFSEILAITKKLMHSANTTYQQRYNITLGLQYLIKKREVSYAHMGFFQKIFSGVHVAKERQQTIAYLKELMQNDTVNAKLTSLQERLNLDEDDEKNTTSAYIKNFKAFCAHIPSDLSVDQLEICLNIYLETDETRHNPAHHSRLLKLSEKIAQLYLKEKKFKQACAVRINTAQSIPPDPKILKALKELSTKKPKNIGVGKHLNSLDTNMLKNGVLHATMRQIDHENKVCLNFKVSHTTRNELETTLDLIKVSPSLCKLLHGALPPAFCKGVVVSMVNDGYYRDNGNHTFSKNNCYNIDKAHEINFKGVGKVIIGKLHGYKCHANLIRIEMEPSIATDKIPQHVHLMLSALGMPPLLAPQNKDDEEKCKIFQLLRCYDPKLEYTLSRDAAYFDLSSSDLQKAIIEKNAVMAPIFKKYLKTHPELMYQQEVYPGKSVWAIGDYAAHLRKKGAVGLMSGVGGYDSSTLNAIKTTLNILKKGALSSQDRFERGLIIQGASSVSDLSSGSGDHVFTRLITTNTIASKPPVHDFPFYGQVQFMYDLEVAERVGYAYGGDQYGTKSSYEYQNRDSIGMLTNKLQHDLPGASIYSNEYCIKNRIPPKYIRGLLVQSEGLKKLLIQALKGSEGKGIITLVDGQALFNGIPLEEFIHVGNTFKTHHWGKKAVDAHQQLEAESTVFPENLLEVASVKKHAQRKDTDTRVVADQRKQFVMIDSKRSSYYANAIAANAAYQLLGAKVPEAKVFQHSPVPRDGTMESELTSNEPKEVLIRPFISGKNLADYRAKSTTQQQKAVEKKIESYFVADCLFGNTAALNEPDKNLVVDAQGELWRIKTGECFNFDANATVVTELENLRSSSLKSYFLSFFNSSVKPANNIADAEIISQINQIIENKKALLALVPNNVRSIMEKRIEYLVSYRADLLAKHNA